MFAQQFQYTIVDQEIDMNYFMKHFIKCLLQFYSDKMAIDIKHKGKTIYKAPSMKVFSKQQNIIMYFHTMKRNIYISILNNA